ncbi:TonB-dependent receptor [Leptospira interrogans]|uniref:Carboxypeptidase regulatory-like domain protein n=1 Tax=Leptospira interrogans serovar Pyrogenes str. 200701872 TaxID=1193029 RepID=M7A2F1_LEPIR|nr:MULTISPECIES: TonB-dependent receptor [Leptospira]EMP04904.1 carboxypeptidase regulatory-like domain protein [Leptospira interrogans serovar Pyrogenes str. 200701872]EKO06797.1 carboxypeptidase regulatory-like domain protein [Leptospira interrogans str. C10069]EMN62404.1 carboxypeptidase regulatory-like domain protein [Leptospira interrogans serovar Pyrogenes str. R168]ULG84508.1 TonB-dependent receptor [Leptospira interrogans]ULG88634.1 TonB-dependent receptor [Leptospira interrogans]
MKHKILSLFFFLSLITSPVLGQSTGKLVGKIVDSESGDPVFGTVIIVRSIKAATRSDFDGKYELNLPPGEHSVEFQMIGFATQFKKITISPGARVSMNVVMGAQVLDTVEVKGRGLENSESALLALQRKSGVVSDAISEEAIKKSPDSSAGDVLRRVTGITLVGGRFIFVRGLGERYSNTILNDSVIPSPEPDKRIVPLDLFPAGVIKNIRVIKTASAEDSAEFSGGIVKIETKEYPDTLSLSVSLGVGKNTQVAGHKFKTFDTGEMNNNFGLVSKKQELPDMISGLPKAIPFVEGDRFGGIPTNLMKVGALSFNQEWSPKEEDSPFNKSFSISAGNSFKTEKWGRFGILAGTTYNRSYNYREEANARFQASNPISIYLKDSNMLRPLNQNNLKIYGEEVLWGNNLNLAYEPKIGQQFFIKTLYSVQSDKIVREGDGANYIDNFNFKSTNLNFISRTIFNNTLGGEHEVRAFSARPHKVEWNVNYALAERDEPDARNQAWSQGGTDLANGYRRLGNNPDGTRYFSSTADTVRSQSLKYEIPFNQWDGLQSKLKFGISNLDRFKHFEFREIAQRNFTGSDRDVIYPIPGEVIYNPLAYANGNRKIYERASGNNAYDASQALRAAFAQLEVPILAKLKSIVGVRYEDSYQKTKTYDLKNSWNGFNTSYGCKTNSEEERLLLVRANICDATNVGIGELRTKDKLPSANVVWEFAKDMNLRLGYSQTLTRPDLRELSPFGFAAYFQADRIFGNASLQRTYIHNYDLRWEYYITNTDYIGVGAFFKNLSNPIELIGLPVAGSASLVYKYANAQQATIRGIELDYRKELLWWLRVEANVFFIKSRVDVIDSKIYGLISTGQVDPLSTYAAYSPTTLNRPLQGQSDFVANLKVDVFVSKSKKHNIGFYHNYFSDRIALVGSDGVPNAIQKGTGTSDVVYTYRHNDRLDFRSSVRNVMNTQFKITQTDPLTGQEYVFQKYRTGLDVSFSATYKL